MPSKDEGCGHLTKIDRCSLVRETTNHHGEEKLEAVLHASGDHDLLILSK